MILLIWYHQKVSKHSYYQCTQLPFFSSHRMFFPPPWYALNRFQSTIWQSGHSFDFNGCKPVIWLSTWVMTSLWLVYDWLWLAIIWLVLTSPSSCGCRSSQGVTDDCWSGLVFVPPSQMGDWSWSQSLKFQLENQTWLDLGMLNMESLVLFRLISWNWKLHNNQRGNLPPDTLNDTLLS